LSGVYNRGKEALAAGTVVWVSSTLKVMLVTSAYVYNPDDASVAAALTAAEVTGSGYTGGFGGAGRVSLGGKSLTRDDSNDLIQYKANPVTWASLNVGSVAGAVVIFEAGGADSGSIPIVYINGGFPLASAGGPFTITPAATGLLQLTG
jgi:hypothetical protein